MAKKKLGNGPRQYFSTVSCGQKKLSHSQSKKEMDYFIQANLRIIMESSEDCSKEVRGEQCI